MEDGDVLAYNSHSIIDKIYTKLNGEVLIYFVCCESKNNFTLSKLNRYLNVETKTDRLDDISKHIILIYESSISLISVKESGYGFSNYTSLGNISRCKTNARIKWISNDECLGTSIGY